MKIKDLENLLSISRSNIRFYEKQGLFSPERQDNNYRDYTDQDILVLKRIIVLRKMGFTVEEIKAIKNNELPFSEAIRTTQQRLEDELEQLTGSLNMVKQVSKDHSSFEEIDVAKWWDSISQSEKAGEKFIDICKDYLEMQLMSFDFMWKYAFGHDFKASRKKHGVIKACVILFVICIIRGIAKVVFWNESFLSGFLYPFYIALAGTIITLPLFLLGLKFPRVASIIITIIFCLIGLFFALLLFLFIYGIINSIAT